MKRVTSFAVLAVGCSLLQAASAAAQAPSANLLRVQTVHNVVVGGQVGMLVQIDADVHDLQGREVVFAAFFYFDGGLVDGRRLPALPGAPGKYVTPDRQVTTQKREIVISPNAGFRNVELFIPYYELSGPFVPLNLKYLVEIQYNDGLVPNRNLATSTYRHITIR